MVNGRVDKRTTLTATVVKRVDFDGNIKQLSLVKNATGRVAYKVNGTVANINDTTANILNNDVIGELINRTDYISYITLVSDVNVEVQWDYDTSYRG
jgi:hypothetical protein